MELRSFFVNITFALIGLACTMGLVGLTVYMSHWYSLLNQEPFLSLFGNKWKVIGIICSSCLALSVVTAVLSFAFDYTFQLLIFSGCLQIPSLVLVIMILNNTKTSQFEAYKKSFIANYYTLPGVSSFEKNFFCAGPKSYLGDNCSLVYSSDTPYCCDTDIDYVLHNRTDYANKWIFGFFLAWIVSMVLLVPMSYFFCETSSKP